MKKQPILSGSVFLSKLITQYALLHKKSAGPAAEEYIRQLGLRTGEWMEGFYDHEEWTPEKYAETIVDLKNSIGGDFYIAAVYPDHVVVKARACPFGEFVKDSPHLCNMTSSVFGGIASRNFGYAKVALRKRIAVKDNGCEIAIYFNDNDCEDGDVYEGLQRTPEHGNPFQWEQETIQLLNEELKETDKLVMKLVQENAALRKKLQS